MPGETDDWMFIEVTGKCTSGPGAVPLWIYEYNMGDSFTVRLILHLPITFITALWRFICDVLFMCAFPFFVVHCAARLLCFFACLRSLRVVLVVRLFDIRFFSLFGFSLVFWYDELFITPVKFQID